MPVPDLGRIRKGRQAGWAGCGVFGADGGFIFGGVLQDMEFIGLFIAKALGVALSFAVVRDGLSLVL